MHDLEGKYEQLELAIGKAAIWWIRLEEGVRHLILTMAMYVDPAFERSPVSILLNDVATNLDIRGLVAAAKAVAHQVDEPSDFYDRAEALLNRIGNDYRNERNRFLHDEWIIGPEWIDRYKRGSVVVRPQSRERLVLTRTERQFASIDEVRAFATLLQVANDEIHHMINEVLDVLDRTRPQPE
jgi:hypothetical protein